MKCQSLAQNDLLWNQTNRYKYHFVFIIYCANIGFEIVWKTFCKPFDNVERMRNKRRKERRNKNTEQFSNDIHKCVYEYMYAFWKVRFEIGENNRIRMKKNKREKKIGIKQSKVVFI